MLFPIPTYTKSTALALKQLAETGRYTPLVGRTFELEDIVEAHRDVETGEKIGNVVLAVR